MLVMQKTPQFPVLESFREWLDAERGRATLLRKHLGINATMISNAKHGRILMPERWFETIEKVSKKKVTLRELHSHRINASLRTAKRLR